MKEESVIAYLRSECSPREREVVEEWISRSVENRQRFKEIKTIWELSGADYSDLPADPEASWSRIHARINGEDLRIKALRKRSFGKHWRIAASLVLILGLGYLALRYSGRGSTPGELVLVRTQAENSEVSLPDGSTVWLKGNSSFTYPSSFGRKDRRVRLEEGEAYFEVDRDRRRPFTVEIGDSRVSVLGTSFNIRFPGAKNEQVVTVATGKVSFHPAGDPSGGVLLTAGERGICSPSDMSYSKGANTDRNFLAWKSGILMFSGTPLDEVCRVLSAHYGKEFRLSDSVDADRQLTVTWNNKKLEEVLKVLSMTLDLSYRDEGEQIIIY